MEQTGRSKTKYTSPHTSTWSTKQTADARIPPDVYWKYNQRNNQETVDKNTRRQQSPMPEPPMSYYSSANSYKTIPFKHQTYPRSTHPKQISPPHVEVPQRYQQINTKSNRNKDYIHNIAVLNKDRYKDQQENENNTRYIDEQSGNFTEDNLEDDAEEEAENDRDAIGEPFNKEYDEQEEDDEVDEESDAVVESHAVQRDAAKKDALLRVQKRPQIVNEQDYPHRSRYQHASKSYQVHPSATRYYHHIPDRGIHEALSEEDLYATQVLKNPPRKSSAGYYQNWISQRCPADRYDTTTVKPSHQARTRPEMKSFIEAEFIDRRKCSRCGNVSLRKPSTSRRDNCRFQDNSNFLAKEQFGDDIEIFDKSWCGNCKPKHHLDEDAGCRESPSPHLYPMKPRRSRDVNTPMHETLDGKHAINELSHEYARIPPRYAKDMPNSSRDKMKRSVHTTQERPANRMPIYYDP